MKLNSNEGFSLLELLVSLTILSLIVLLLFPSIRVMHDGSEKLSNKLASINERENLERLLRQNLSAALPIQFFDTHQSKVYFTGSPKGIKYLFPGPAGPEKRNISNKNKNSLEFTHGILETSIKSFRLQNFNFSYFGRLSSNPSPKWHSNWKNQKKLPKLIRFSVKNRFPLIIKIRITS